MGYNSDTNFQYIQESNNKKKKGFITNFKESTDNNDNKEFIVTIEGIHVTTTGNNTEYTESELKGSPKNLTGVHSWTKPYNNPVLTHHNQRSGEPIGRVIEAKYSNSTISGKPGIVLKAKISDEKAIEKIKDGRYTTVSVGGNVAHAECSICGTDWVTEGWCEHTPGQVYDGEEMSLIMKDITFVEVSFVNVPADEYANVIAYDTIESSDDSTTYENKYNSKTAFREDTFSRGQGGKSNNMSDGNSKSTIEEKLELREEKINLLENKLESKEDEVKKLEEENKDLNDKVDILENDIENYQDEIKNLNEANKKLKDEQVDFLVEKILDKKIELDRLSEDMDDDTKEEVKDNLKEKNRESLKDILEDLKYEEELNKEDYDGFNNTSSKDGKHNSEENNVKTVEDDDDGEEEFNVDEELKNLG